MAEFADRIGVMLDGPHRRDGRDAATSSNAPQPRLYAAALGGDAAARRRLARGHAHERAAAPRSSSGRHQDLHGCAALRRARRRSPPCATSRLSLEARQGAGAGRRVRLGQVDLGARDDPAVHADRRAASCFAATRHRRRFATARRRWPIRAPCRWCSRIRSRRSTRPTPCAIISRARSTLHRARAARRSRQRCRRIARRRRARSRRDDRQISARALGRRAPARQPRPRARGRRRADRRRRADLDARRLDPALGARPDAPAEGRARHRASSTSPTTSPPRATSPRRPR